MKTKQGFSIEGTSALQPQKTPNHSARIISFDDLDTRSDLELLDDMYLSVASSPLQTTRARMFASLKHHALSSKSIRSLVSSEAKECERHSTVEITSVPALVSFAVVSILFTIGLMV